MELVIIVDLYRANSIAINLQFYFTAATCLIGGCQTSTSLSKLHFESINTKILFYSRCYATNKDKAYLIFEDLSAIGFKNVNRRTGLDIAHFKLVLSILAKYHAATAVLVEKVSFETISKDSQCKYFSSGTVDQKVF